MNGLDGKIETVCKIRWLTRILVYKVLMVCCCFFYRTKVFSGLPKTRNHSARPTDICSIWQSSTMISTTPYACWRTISNAFAGHRSGYPCHGCTNPTLPLMRVWRGVIHLTHSSSSRLEITSQDPLPLRQLLDELTYTVISPIRNLTVKAGMLEFWVVASLFP